MTSKVYVGGSNDRVWRYYRGNSDDWNFVRQNADGWYINNFAMKKAMRQPNIDEILRDTADKFTNKNVFFETDMDHSTDAADQRSVEILSSHFNITNCCINRAHDKSLSDFAKRRNMLKSGDSNRPVQVQLPPWKVEGNFHSASELNDSLHELIRHAQGSATDGPLTLWKDNGDLGQGNMRLRPGGAPGGSITSVEWVRHQNPNFQTMVMLAPCTLNGQEFFDAVVDCVRLHEEFEASPDIWALSFYGPACFYSCPVMPDSWFDDGEQTTCKTPPHLEWSSRAGEKPAETFMGAAWWLINHLRDPEKWP